MTVEVIGGPRREEIMQDTWGHLAPSPRKLYQGSIVMAHGDYGDLVILRVDFPDLPDSPWFYEDLREFVGHQMFEVEAGTVHRFVGTYRYTKRMGGIFAGVTLPIPLEV